MPLRLILVFIVAALLLAGVGDSLGRTFVENPAWRQLSIEAWAAFSRVADLGNGTILYPVEGIGGTLLIAAAAISFRLGLNRPLSAAIPIYAALVMRIGVLLATAEAAPIMLSVKGIGHDPAALRKAFEDFALWGNIRATFVTLGYCAEVWALLAIFRMVYLRPTKDVDGQSGADKSNSYPPSRNSASMSETRGA